jgi:hypothetical protein
MKKFVNLSASRIKNCTVLSVHSQSSFRESFLSEMAILMTFFRLLCIAASLGSLSAAPHAWSTYQHRSAAALTSAVITASIYLLRATASAAKHSAPPEKSPRSDKNGKYDDMLVSADTGAALYLRAQLLESRGDLAAAAEDYFNAMTRPSTAPSSSASTPNKHRGKGSGKGRGTTKGGGADAGLASFSAVDALSAFMRCHRGMGSEHLAYLRLGNAYV